MNNKFSGEHLKGQERNSADHLLLADLLGDEELLHGHLVHAREMVSDSLQITSAYNDFKVRANHFIIIHPSVSLNIECCF